MVRVLFATLLATVFAATPAHAQTGQADAGKGQQIAAQVCAACHMADGNSQIAANPKLAGQVPEYLAKQLRNFKPQGSSKPERENAIMTGMVAALSPADISNVAAYYAGQTLKPEVAKDKNLAAVGQRLYRGGNAASGVPACSGCHGPAGDGIPAQYPRISGQFAEYVALQLKAFRAGSRANDPNGMMRGAAARMTDEEIAAVAEYVSGLR